MTPAEYALSLLVVVLFSLGGAVVATVAADIVEAGLSIAEQEGWPAVVLSVVAALLAVAVGGGVLLVAADLALSRLP